MAVVAWRGASSDWFASTNGPTTDLCRLDEVWQHDELDQYPLDSWGFVLPGFPANRASTTAIRQRLYAS